MPMFGMYQDLERERSAKAELEKMVHLEKPATFQGSASKYSPNYVENGILKSPSILPLSICSFSLSFSLN